MGLDLEYPAGATPLDEDEKAGLIPSHISNRGELNAWEQENILEGERWAFARRRKDILTLKFLQELHRRMFGRTWRWAGKFPTTEKNIGVDPLQIAPELKKLVDDVAYQIDHKAYSLDEIAARFHHRLTWIHPFPNGNGRHARLMTDLLLTRNGAPPFSWGEDDLVADTEIRRRYIAALRSADARDYTSLFAFVRSGQASK